MRWFFICGWKHVNTYYYHSLGNKNPSNSYFRDFFWALSVSGLLTQNHISYIIYYYIYHIYNYRYIDMITHVCTYLHTDIHTYIHTYIHITKRVVRITLLQRSCRGRMCDAKESRQIYSAWPRPFVSSLLCSLRWQPREGNYQERILMERVCMDNPLQTQENYLAVTN